MSSSAVKTHASVEPQSTNAQLYLLSFFFVSCSLHRAADAFFLTGALGGVGVVGEGGAGGGSEQREKPMKNDLSALSVSLLLPHILKCQTIREPGRLISFKQHIHPISHTHTHTSIDN